MEKVSGLLKFTHFGDQRLRNNFRLEQLGMLKTKTGEKTGQKMLLN